MRKARTTVVTKLLVVATLALFMVAQLPGVLSSAEAVKATTAVKHKPLKHFVAGHRIRVEAKVADPQGVSLVRCYFRAAGQADYVFVGMKAGDSDTFTGILPAPGAETKNIEYLFLAVNGINQVVKTQAFRTEVKDTGDLPSWQQAGSEGPVSVSSELTQASAPAGFSDSIAFDVAESSVRFGVVAGLYGTTQLTAGGGATGAAASGAATGSSAGTAAVATSVGTVAVAAGLSTTAVVGAGAAAAVVVGAGAAAAAGSGGDGSGGGDSSSGGGGGGAGTSACAQYAGNWTGEQRGTGCYYDVVSPGYVWHDPITITVGSDCTASYCIAGCMDSVVSGDTLSFVGYDNCGTRTIVGSFTSPTSASGTYSESQGGGQRHLVSDETVALCAPLSPPCLGADQARDIALPLPLPRSCFAQIRLIRSASFTAPQRSGRGATGSAPGGCDV